MIIQGLPQKILRRKMRETGNEKKELHINRMVSILAECMTTETYRSMRVICKIADILSAIGRRESV